MSQQKPQKIRVWDLPVRVFHWLLVLAVFGGWFTHDDSRLFSWHLFFGTTALILLLFRLLWGVVGSRYARFASFRYSPGQVWGHLKSVFANSQAHYVGHNPTGSWAIFFILFCLFLISISGLFVLSGEEQVGPLAGIVSFRQSVFWRELHEISVYLLLITVAVHVAGVIAESILQRSNLVAAMLDGRKTTSHNHSVKHYAGVALVLVAVIGVFSAVYFNSVVRVSSDGGSMLSSNLQFVEDEVWSEECGSCHLPYHPSLLPQRSWAAMLEQQQDHFGEDLMLEAELSYALLSYSLENASEFYASEDGWKIYQSIPHNQIPLRVTETLYWEKKHQHFDSAAWKHEAVNGKGSCDSCHLDAESWRFDDISIQVPGAVRLKDGPLKLWVLNMVSPQRKQEI